MADSDDDLPWSGPPGGSVRFIIKGEGSLVAYSDDVLPLSGPPGGSVRYIIQGEGPLVADRDEDLQYLRLVSPVARQVFHFSRGIARGG